MKIGTIVCLASTALCLSLSPAQAESSKIGYINVGRVFESTVEGKAILEQLQGEFQKKQKELDERMKAFEEKYKDFLKQQAMLKDDVKQERAQFLEKEQRELQQLYFQYQGDINKRKGEALGKFEEKVMGVVQAVAQKEGLDFILRQEVLLHAPLQLDITNEVIREYDKRHPGGSAKAPKGK